MTSETNYPESAPRGFEAFNDIEKELSACGLFKLAHWFDDSGHPDAALKYYRNALVRDPGLAEAHYNMGVIYCSQNKPEKGVFHLEKAIQTNPDIADSYCALAMVWWSRGHVEKALVFLEQAIRINPKFTEAHFNLGLIFHQMGEYQRSLACYHNASACNPEFAPARWLHLLSLPIIYETVAQIDLMRQQFSRNLDLLITSISLETPQQIRFAVDGLKTATNFYLQYQGRNDIELQSKYGRLAHSIMSARYPQWRAHPATAPPHPGGTIRIGYISAFMCRHTVGTFLAGWLENHDRDQFEVHCYHLGAKSDDLTAHLQQCSHRFHHITGDIETMAAQVASDRLHILVYSEIGMHAGILQLAALRLAPVQCVSWGHPVTSGLPTIDYFLSSDLMEPRTAERFYSETLVRLPNLSLCYHPPKLPSIPMSRTALGLPDDRFIFLSSQSIYKYLPQHDELYPLIAKEAPHAFFVFIGHQNHLVTRCFRNRLRAAFQRHNLNADCYCHFCPRLDTDGFLSLNMVADVFLDTLSWSGGKTTLEAISCGLPVVTCPGRFMRGRHAFAMLTMMGMEDTIARNISEYCKIAIHLASDKAYHAEIKARVRTNRSRLYRDKACIKALESFYQSLFRQHPGRSGIQGPESRTGDQTRAESLTVANQRI